MRKIVEDLGLSPRRKRDLPVFLFIGERRKFREFLAVISGATGQKSLPSMAMKLVSTRADVVTISRSA
ncbi:hypothetical protein MJ572_05920 [Escherichia coli]|nr:hypothetical protein MJ572_05920 [Escherichia coli]